MPCECCEGKVLGKRKIGVDPEDWARAMQVFKTIQSMKSVSVEEKAVFDQIRPPGLYVDESGFNPDTRQKIPCYFRYVEITCPVCGQTDFDRKLNMLK
jgi:hypothetical protein